MTITPKYLHFQEHAGNLAVAQYSQYTSQSLANELTSPEQPKTQ